MEGQRKIRKWIVMFAAFFLILITGSEKKVCAETVDTFSINLKVTEYYDRANQVLDYVNEERKRLGVQPLVLDADLQEAAMQRAASSMSYTDIPDRMADHRLRWMRREKWSGKMRRWVVSCF